MDMIRRLAYAGMDIDSAVETVMWFRQQGEGHKLEQYVNEIEERQKNGVCAL